ncbi:PAC2 family protein [Alloscardovia macacae]|uniref:PAC2 family n=1 Tax=Alloscardovia macacae TaxID=1160091 RepID=A0A261F5R7_9BIFI|nr:PAC2 family protein [Alloscardovia macacae]OZG54470.1 PAC2 family [Alloscardovia macacae]
MTDSEEFMYDEAQPQRHRTVMLAAFEGWNDAGQVATGALNHLVSMYGDTSQEVGHICCGTFFDYTTTRPVMVNVQGRRKIMWPEITFTEIQVNPSLTLLVEIGPEPNFKWTEFSQRSLALAEEREVDEVITLGSMFADCVHTRPLPTYFSNSANNTADENSYTGPIGIPSVLNFAAVDNGFTTHSLWVSVPSYAQYIDAQENPLGMLRVIEALGEYLGVELKTGALPVLALKWKTQADMLATVHEDVATYIQNAEKYYDDEQKRQALSPDATLQLISETEKFLRGFNGEDTAEE